MRLLMRVSAEARPNTNNMNRLLILQYPIVTSPLVSQAEHFQKKGQIKVLNFPQKRPLASVKTRDREAQMLVPYQPAGSMEDFFQAPSNFII